jgi:hypothetical protein
MTENCQSRLLPRAYYSAPVTGFPASTPETTLGASLTNSGKGAASSCPTPATIETAQWLYAQHSVDAIARHDAGARNLRVTSTRIEELVEQARSSGSKIICLVTGVPGRRLGTDRLVAAGAA